MFDILLSLIKKEQVKLIEFYLKLTKEQGNGFLALSTNNNKGDLRYYLPNKIPSIYSDIEKEIQEKIKNVSIKAKNNKKATKVKDKWIITLPIIELETDKDITIPVWNLLLDDNKNHVFFQGFPQEVKLKNNKTGLQYVFVAEPHEATICKNNWTVEATTNGQIYLETCLEASKIWYKFMTFRSDSSYCKIVIPGTKDEGSKILERISDNKDIMNNLDNFRKNDKVGTPIAYNYGKHGIISPGTLKHINTLYELQKYFGNMNKWNIIEFGGGYGGLAYIMSNIVKWTKYSFVEIKEPLELAKQCFKSMDLKKINPLLPKNVDKEEKYDLFISEYGFCELNKDGIDNFMFMLENSKNAYLTMNLWDKNKKKELKNKLLKIFKTVEENEIFLKSEWGDYLWICKK